MKTRDFEIPFAGLKLGKHHFEYNIDNTFFSLFDFQEYNDADVQVDICLDKRSNLMEAELSARGTVNVNCDLSNEPFDMNVEGELKLVIKFGEAFNDENDDILILPHGAHQMNLSQYIYEMLVLAVPAKRIHPGVEDGSLKSEILEKLESLEIKEVENTKEDTDPRWDDLKKLLTNK